MNSIIGNMSIITLNSTIIKPYSEATAVNQKVKKLIEQAYDRAIALISKYGEAL